jgi:putative membrane protein
MQILFLIFGLIVAGIAVIFAAQNAKPISINFFGNTTEISLAIALLISMLLGALVSILVFLPSLGRSKWANRKQRKKITELETRLSDTQGILASSQQKILELEQKLDSAVNPVKPSSSVSTSQNPSAPISDNLNNLPINSEKTS